MFPSADLSWMRDELEKAMPDTCYVLNKTSVSNGAGGLTDTWGTALTTVCRLDTTTTYRADQAGQLQAYTSQVLTLPHNTTINEANRVKVGSDIYTVTGVSRGSWALDVRVKVELV